MRIIIHGQSQRDYAHKRIDELPKGAVIQFLPDNRTLEQNKALWPRLADIRKHGFPGRENYTDDDWKCVFMRACGHEIRYLIGLDGRPFPTDNRSSKLTKSEFADLLTFIIKFGDENGVAWSEPKERKAND